MHTAWNRANAVLTLSSTVITTLFCIAAFVDNLHKGRVHVRASVNRIDSLRQEPAMEFYYSRSIKREAADRARLGIDLDIDLRDEFTWLTKQLFLYVTVEFETATNRLNQVVIWSQIIENQEHAALEGKNLDELYPYVLNDQGFGLRGRPFNLTVSWNIMPYVGVLRTRSKSFTGFRFPTDYTPKPQTREVGERSDRVASPAAKKAAIAARNDASGEVLAAEAETGLFDEERYEEGHQEKEYLLRDSSAGDGAGSHIAYGEATYTAHSQSSDEL